MDPLSLIPPGSQYDTLRWMLSILSRDFPDLYATLRADRVSGWVAEIDSGTGRDADQIRDDIARYVIGVDRLMATYGITAEMAELVILGGNEGGINFSDLTPISTPGTEPDPLSLIPQGAQYDTLRWMLSILSRDFPDLYATLRADRVSGWVAEIASGTGRDADQIRDDIARYVIGVDRLMATYGITAEMAELVILGGNEGGINFSDLTPISTPGTEPDPTPVDFREQAGLLFPYLPSQLLDIFADAWADTGDVNLALATMRADPTYDTFFPGNRREDGSLRMSEAEYFSRVDAYNKAFRGWGLNPELFKGKYATLIAGDVTGATLANRIAAAHEQVLHQMPQVREVYARYAGIELSDEAILASFLDPDVADGILSRRIAVSQVGAEGEARGFTINLPFAERLHFAGVDQQRAREFFTSAEGRVPTLDELARRFADPDPDFDIVEFAEAAVFGSASQERRVRRLLAAEASLFSDQLGAVRTTGSDFALTGLNPV